MYDNVTVISSDEKEGGCNSDPTYYEDYRQNPCYKAALSYLSMGWSPIALCPRTHLGVGIFHHKNCDKPGKTPVGLKRDMQWKQWQLRLPTKDELTEQWKATPNANVGVVMGRVSGIISVDVDGSIKEAFEQLPWLELLETVEFSTGNGSRFVYESNKAHIPSRIYKFRGGRIELLAEGRQSVMPPSLHLSGKQYRWTSKGGTLASYRPWNVSPSTSVIEETPTSQDVCAILEGARNDTLFRIGSAMRRFGADKEEILYVFKRVNKRCSPPMREEELYTIATSAMKYKPII